MALIGLYESSQWQFIRKYSFSSNMPMKRGFTVAVGLLESQLQELKKKTLFYRDENKMIAERQEYEAQALQEIFGIYNLLIPLYFR